MDQYIQLRELFENRQFEALNSIFEEYRQAFNSDTGKEFVIFSGRVISAGVSLPGKIDNFHPIIAVGTPG